MDIAAFRTQAQRFSNQEMCQLTEQVCQLTLHMRCFLNMSIPIMFEPIWDTIEMPGAIDCHAHKVNDREN